VSLELTGPLVLGLAAVVLVAGVVNGIAGFGFALVGTMVLASVLDPATAVVFMILPVLAANLRLVGELSAADLRSCGSRFAPLLLAALVGTILGMVVLDRLPETPLRVGLGLLTLGFVTTSQQLVTIPWLDRVREGCFVETAPAMAGLGAVSGLVFGGTNVGVQLIAYLKSCELRHGLFVGVVALVFLGLNAVRVVAAGTLGLYTDLATVGLSAAASIPAVVGVAVGQRLRERITTVRRRMLVLGLLTVVGTRLVLGGVGLL
jgi:uncharacterized membrane protein YfcA